MTTDPVPPVPGLINQLGPVIVPVAYMDVPYLVQAIDRSQVLTSRFMEASPGKVSPEELRWAEASHEALARIRVAIYNTDRNPQ